ncbi:site-specific integrase [Ammoniphilus sp. CFH 90114]|uniref:tyrosine-type recombinase/integrase n=1 Tax=Ammoniphilus sp. CFH 90114 TaxID=2493665 RepID=UPI0013E95397|nr:site-specific integrase [Ammoniphilus sp. CFH 90114]
MNPLWPENESYIEEYAQEIKQRKEGSTVKLYLSEAKHYLIWLQQKKKSFHEMTKEDLLECREDMLLKGRKITTVNKWISVMSSFLKWAKGRGYLTTNFAEHLRFLEEKKDKPKWLSMEQEMLLLKQAEQERSSLKKARNEALIYVLLYAGLRVEEVSDLLLDSIDQGELVVMEEDVEKRRIPIDLGLQVKLLDWLKYRSQSMKVFHQESSSLFVTERSGNMQPRSIQFVVEGYSDKLGFTVTCQILRHTFCRRLVEKGVPLQTIKQWAGHKSIQSTLRYVEE